MKTSYKYIRFERQEPKDHKRWFCYSKNDNVEIAEVLFYEPWKQWVIEQRPDTIFNNDCLIDVAHFLTQLNESDIWDAAQKALLKKLLKQTDGSCGVRKCVPMNYIRNELEKL